MCQAQTEKMDFYELPNEMIELDIRRGAGKCSDVSHILRFNVVLTTFFSELMIFSDSKAEQIKLTKSVSGRAHLEFHLGKALTKSKYVEWMNFL